jgi:hypothetical protein
MRWWWGAAAYVVFIYSSAKYPFDLHHLLEQATVVHDYLDWYFILVLHLYFWLSK